MESERNEEARTAKVKEEINEFGIGVYITITHHEINQNFGNLDQLFEARIRDAVEAIKYRMKQRIRNPTA